MEIRKILEEDVWKDPIKSVSNLETLGEDLLSIDLESEVPNNRIIIDRFPVPLRYPLSDDLEIFYDDSKTENATLFYYLQEEQRFVEVLKRLWSLSPVFVQSNLVDRDIEVLKNNIDDYGTLGKVYYDSSNSKIFEIELTKYLELLTRLSLREKIHSCFVFPEIKLLVRTNGLVLEVYVGDPSRLEILQKISLTHGLYLR